MPLPFAPLVPLVLRIGLATAAGLAVKRFLSARRFDGRTDQRLEDALDDLGEGVAVHRPSDRMAPGDSQTNTSARLVRTIRIGNRRVEIDGALIARLRIRKG